MPSYDREPKKPSVYLRDGYFAHFNESGALHFITYLKGRIASDGYHDIEVREFVILGQETPVEIVVGKIGGVEYILRRNEKGFYEEVAGPYHHIEFSKDSGMLQATAGIEGQPGFSAEVLDPLALPTEAISR